MPVYNKKGLDYFAMPVNHYESLKLKRLRRMCRANGLAVYSLLLCQLYAVKGYFLTVTEELVEDIAEDLALTVEEVNHIISVCCKLGIFSSEIYKRDGVLTSADIQMSYVDICSRIRRDFILMDVNLLLISNEDIEHVAGVKKIEKEMFSIKVIYKLKGVSKIHSSEECVLSSEESLQNKIKEKKGKENILFPKSLLRDSGEGTSEADGGCALRMEVPAGGEADAMEAERLKEEKDTTILPDPHTPCPRGEGRNYSGLVENLQRFRLEVKDINAILRMSNFGEVGDPVWQAIYEINNSAGRIKQPVKYIYSVINKSRRNPQNPSAL